MWVTFVLIKIFVNQTVMIEHYFSRLVEVL